MQIIVVALTLLCLLRYFLRITRTGIDVSSAAPILFILFFYLYSGHTIYKTSGYQLQLTVSYILFLLSYLVTLEFFLNIKGLTSISAKDSIRIYLLSFLNRYSPFIITLYLFLVFSYIIFPEFRISLLINPPNADIKQQFITRMEGVSGGMLVSIRDYLTLLVMPFFLLALFHRVNSFLFFLFFVIIILYLKYLDSAYIGRGALACYLFLTFMFVYLKKPRYRIRLYVTSSVSVLFFMLFSYYYRFLRLGVAIDDVSFFQAITYILEAESSLLWTTGVDLLSANEGVKIFGYFTWLVTFFIPKFILPGFESYSINQHISEIVLGLGTQTSGYFIVLPGLLVESIFIYGNYLFFVHAVMLAIVTALLIRLSKLIPNSQLLGFYIIWLGSYNLNRGGVTSFLAQTINPLILVFFLLSLLFVSLRLTKR